MNTKTNEKTVDEKLRHEDVLTIEEAAKIETAKKLLNKSGTRRRFDPRRTQGQPNLKTKGI